MAENVEDASHLALFMHRLLDTEYRTHAITEPEERVSHRFPVTVVVGLTLSRPALFGLGRGRLLKEP